MSDESRSEDEEVVTYPPGLTLKRTSTVDQATDVLRRLILTGELRPGRHLPEVSLARSLGISRNTVREAIPILASEGLVRREPHRGAVVATLTAEDITDLYRVRRILELSALDVDPTDAEVERIGLAVEQMESAASSENRHGTSLADTQFHAGIASLLSSPRINRFFAQISVESSLALGWSMDAEGADGAEGVGYEDLDAVAAEHRAIYAEIANGRRAQAKYLLTQHLEDSEQRLQLIFGRRTPVRQDDRET